MYGFGNCLKKEHKKRSHQKVFISTSKTKATMLRASWTGNHLHYRMTLTTWPGSLYC